MDNDIATSKFLPEIINTELDVSDESKDINTLFKEGLKYYRIHNLAKSLECFNSIINLDPNMPECYVNIGSIYFKQKKLNEAISSWKKALSIDSTQAICYINIGKAFYALGNIQEAIAHWHVAVTMAPNHAITLLNLGIAYEKLKDKASSFKFYELYLFYCSTTNSSEYIFTKRKVNYAKKVALHNIEAGVKLQKYKKLQKALKAYILSIKAYPNFPKAYLNLGSICYMANKFEHAIKYWLKAVQLDPTYAKTYCNLAVAYEKVKHPDNAFCMYNKYIKYCTEPTGDYYDIVARIDYLKQELSSRPDLVKKHLDNADELYRNKKYTNALWEYENYIILNPSQESILRPKINEISDILDPVKKAAKTAYEIGNACFKALKYDKALQAYKRYVYLCPEGEHVKEVKNIIKEYDKIMWKKLNRSSRVE